MKNLFEKLLFIVLCSTALLGATESNGKFKFLKNTWKTCRSHGYHTREYKKHTNTISSKKSNYKLYCIQKKVCEKEIVRFKKTANEALNSNHPSKKRIKKLKKDISDNDNRKNKITGSCNNQSESYILDNIKKIRSIKNENERYKKEINYCNWGINAKKAWIFEWIFWRNWFFGNPYSEKINNPCKTKKILSTEKSILTNLSPSQKKTIDKSINGITENNDDISHYKNQIKSLEDDIEKLEKTKLQHYNQRIRIPQKIKNLCFAALFLTTFIPTFFSF